MHEDEHSLGSSISGYYLGEESILPSPTHTTETTTDMVFAKVIMGWGGFKCFPLPTSEW